MTSSTSSTTTPPPPPTNQEEWKSCFRSNLFINKIALVTGGGTGIGYSITKELASLGATVVIASRSIDKCQLAAIQLNKELGHEERVVVGPSTSIRDEIQVKALIEFVLEKFGKLDYLVNNAGGQFVSDASDLTKKGFSAVVETNLVGTFLMCREAYRQYMQDHGGSIVNITLGNRNGFPLMSHSGAARAGIENLSISLSQEWISSGVRINCVRPGIIFTSSGFDNYGPMGNEFLDKVLKKQPSRRLGTPEEIASATCWLLSDGASYVTGAILQVDGGSAYHAVPLLDMDHETSDKNNDPPILPVYGTLPLKARL